MKLTGEDGKVVAELDELRRTALDRLLEMSARLDEVGRMAPCYASLIELGNGIAEQACALAGLHSLRPIAAVSERLVAVFELEQPASKLWNCRAQIPKGKIDVHYLDGPSREVAIANALILLARGILDALPTEGLITPELGLSCDLEEAMAEYDQALVPSSEELARQRAAHPPLAGPGDEPEPSFHGAGGVD